MWNCLRVVYYGVVALSGFCLVMGFLWLVDLNVVLCFKRVFVLLVGY